MTSNAHERKASKDSRSAAPTADKGEISKALDALFEPSDIIELRAIHKKRKQTDAGYFDNEHRDMLAEEAVRLNATGAAVYVNLNRLDPQLLARYANRIERYAQTTATDANITRRRWLLVDFDPVRPKDTSATLKLKKAAINCAKRCVQALRAEGWPAPIVADSGNGRHLLYRLDLSNDKESTELIKGALAGLALRFDSAQVTVDQAVSNAGRIIKLYGTVATKGDHTRRTPWRLSKLKTVPARNTVVTIEQLRALHPPGPSPHARRTSSPDSAAFDLDTFLDRLGIDYQQDTHEDRDRYKLDHCPFNTEHGKGEAAIFQARDGTLGFKCQHNGCADKHWQDVRALVDGSRETRSRRSCTAKMADLELRTDEEVIKRLATLSPIEYDRCRVAEAERLRVRPLTLDKQVEQHRKSAVDESSGHAVLFSEPKPWVKSVDGAALLDALADTFSRYLVLPSGAADALALWTVHTHVYSAFEYTPRLNITGPVKQCGKTLLMDVLQTLVASGLRAENLSTAVLFRLVDAKKPTLLIDEYDSFLRGNEELRGALNAGQKRGGQVLRCAGDDHEVRGFNVFAPVALAGIGPLPGTLADRSIIIRMERAKRGEVQARFDSRITDREQKLKRKLMRWAQDNRQRLEACDPEMPGLYNRRADTWRPLFAIAEVARGPWPQRVIAANKALESKSDESESAGVLLLADIRRIFKQTKQDRLSSNGLVEGLQRMEERPWPEYKHGKPITARQVADLLRPFDIGPRTLRDGDDTFKGYKRSQFKGAWSRYLNVSGTRSQRAASSDDSIRPKKHKEGNVTDRKRAKLAKRQKRDRVTDQGGG